MTTCQLVALNLVWIFVVSLITPLLPLSEGALTFEGQSDIRLPELGRSSSMINLEHRNQLEGKETPQETSPPQENPKPTLVNLKTYQEMEGVKKEVKNEERTSSHPASIPPSFNTNPYSYRIVKDTAAVLALIKQFSSILHALEETARVLAMGKMMGVRQKGLGINLTTLEGSTGGGAASMQSGEAAQESGTATIAIAADAGAPITYAESGEGSGEGESGQGESGQEGVISPRHDLNTLDTGSGDTNGSIGEGEGGGGGGDDEDGSIDRKKKKWSFKTAFVTYRKFDLKYYIELIKWALNFARKLNEKIVGAVGGTPSDE